MKALNIEGIRIYQDECWFCDGLITSADHTTATEWFNQKSGYICQGIDNLGRPHYSKTYHHDTQLFLSDLTYMYGEVEEEAEETDDLDGIF